MRITVVVLLLSSLMLSACGGGLRESRLNPANWFGRSTSQPVEAGKVVRPDGTVEEVNPLIGKRKQSRQAIGNRKRSSNSGSFFDAVKKAEIYGGTPVDQITELTIERTSTGAIVRATGVTSRQGAFDVRLVPVGDGEPADGVLTLELLAVQPINTYRGPEYSRRVEAALPLSRQKLEKIREIRVIGRRNMRSTRRG